MTSVSVAAAAALSQRPALAIVPAAFPTPTAAATATVASASAAASRPAGGLAVCAPEASAREKTIFLQRSRQQRAALQRQAGGL